MDSLGASGQGAGARSAWLPRSSIPIVAGVGIGLLATLLMMADGALIIAVLVLAGAFIVPVFFVRDLSLYCVVVFLLALPFEASVGITGRGVDVESLIATMGLSPTNLMAVKLFPTDLLLALLLLLWGLDLVRRRTTLWLPSGSWLAFAFVGWGVLSALLKSQYPMLSTAQLVHEIKYLLLFVYLANFLVSRQRIDWFTGALIAVAVMEVAVTLVMWRAGYSRDSLVDRMGLGVSHEFEFLRSSEQDMETLENFRASGTFGAASHLAMYMQTLWPLLLALGITAVGLARRSLYLLLFAAAAAAIYVTQSRSGLAGLAVGFVGVLAVARLRGYLPNPALLVFAYAGSVLIATLSANIYEQVVSRPQTYFQRFVLLEQGMVLVAGNPILGVGPNNSTSARVELLHRDREREFDPDIWAPDDDLYPIHNQWMVEVAERGLVGAGLGLAFLTMIGLRAVRLAGHADRRIATLAIAAVGALLGLGTQQLGDHFAVNATHSMLWIWCAVIVALDRLVGGGNPAPRI